MPSRISESRMLWLAVGLLAGLSIAYLWPHEPVAASSNDRDGNKFGIMTTPISVDAEGVFVLDYLTGRLTGAVMNVRTAKFGVVYGRSVAADFNVNPKVQPHYVFVGGRATLSSRGRVTPATSVIYVAEMTSGKVIAYGLNYQTPRARNPVLQPLSPLDVLNFRRAVKK